MVPNRARHHICSLDVTVIMLVCIQGKSCFYIYQAQPRFQPFKSTDSFSHGQSTYKKAISIIRFLYKPGFQMTSFLEVPFPISGVLSLLSLEDQIDLSPSTAARW